MRTAAGEGFEFSQLEDLPPGRGSSEEIGTKLRSSISFAFTMVNSKVVSRELLSPADVSRAQARRIHESTEVVVVSQHDNFMLGALQIVPPILESSLSTGRLPESFFWKSTLASEFRKLDPTMFLAFICPPFVDNEIFCRNRK